MNGIEVKENYTQEEVDALVARSPYYKATANDIDWLQKVRMQGRIQRWVDHSISVTINLPSDVSEEMNSANGTKAGGTLLDYKMKVSLQANEILEFADEKFRFI